jgi:hypothetical protein
MKNGMKYFAFVPVYVLSFFEAFKNMINLNTQNRKITNSTNSRMFFAVLTEFM